ncbi:TatD DNase family protein [Isoptericola chiayiensis]|nr:TatD DNase family protein [Isoptericola chiayiensis]
MTRTLDEARQVRSRRDTALVWGVGVHPGLAAARAAWDAEQFKELIGSFALVGEIGLDRRGGDFPRQRSILKEILSVVSDEPVLVSVHSSGAAAEVVECLCEADVRGAILHWFNGDSDDTMRAVDSGAYFSVNAAMSPDRVSMFPPERVLCETDFPARRIGARQPADVQSAERMLSQIWNKTVAEVRAKTWWNLRNLSESSGAIERLPSQVADTLLYL